MATDNVVTIAGNLTDDPELHFTPSGAAVSNFTVAQTPRYFDNNTSEWKDGDTVFLRCNVWRDQAEHVAESLRRGNRVVVTGSLRQRNWEDKDGNPRTSFEMQVDEVAASMRFATVSVHKATRQAETPPPPDEEKPAATRDNSRAGRTTERRERAASRR